MGGYGVTTTTLTSPPTFSITANTWSMDNWGQDLLAVPVGFSPIGYQSNTLVYQPIYYWDPTILSPKAQVIANAPSVNTGIFVAMPQRQIMSWWSSFTGIPDPLLVRWCDVNNFNVWIGQVTNQAGSYRLSSGSLIIGGMQVAQQSLFWTDLSLWAAQYQGLPYVYGFNKLADGCGLIARNSRGVLNGVVFWMGNEQFFKLDANGVSVIQCPIWDVVFQNLDLGNKSNIICATNSLFGEVTWHYPVTNGTGENTGWVTYHAMIDQWTFGS
jgi:hypothetical protein